MSDRKCFTCKCEGRKGVGSHLDTIYLDKGEHSYIYQCYNHSVELFKMGQSNFIAKYKTQNLNFDFSEKSPINPHTDYFPFRKYA